MFIGKAMILVKGLPTSPVRLLEGKRRHTWFALQGRFKQPISFDDLIISQEYSRGLKFGYGGNWMWKGFTKVAQLISPCTEIGPRDAPSLTIPVAAKAQAIQMSLPGQEPNLSNMEALEDLRSLGAEFTMPDGAPLPARDRVAFFEQAANRRRYVFDTQHVWTFHGYQHLINVARFCLDLSFLMPGMRFDLAKFVDGQPVQLALRECSSGRYLLAFELWHEAVLLDAHRRLEATRAAAAARR